MSLRYRIACAAASVVLLAIIALVALSARLAPRSTVETKG